MKTALTICAMILLLEGCKGEPKEVPGAVPVAEPAVAMTAEDYARLGIAKQYQEWDFDAARDAFLKAVQLNPEDAWSHAHLGWYRVLEENREAALEAITKAREADPENTAFVRWSGWMCYFLKDFECAEAKMKESLQREPEHPVATLVLAQVSYLKGDIPEALVWLEKAGRDSAALPARALQHLLEGRKREARATADSIAAQADPNTKIVLVFLYDALGEREMALDWLERNFQARLADMPWLRLDPMIQSRSLDGEPRFEAVVDQVGRPQGSR